MENTSKPSPWLLARLAFWVIVPIVLLVLPSDAFDTGPPLCLSMLLFKVECFSCGMTRGCMHLIHLEFDDAWYYNPLCYIVFPVLAFFWAKWFLADWKKYRAARA